MKIWLDDIDFIRIIVEDKIVAEIKSTGEARFERLEVGSGPTEQRRES